MPRVDVVVVTYNSAETIRACLGSLSAIPDIEVIVVDNASRDETAAVVSSFSVNLTRLPDNRGFSHGNNVGTALGQAGFILFLNPDATIDEASLDRLVETLQEDEGAAIAAPRILNADGSIALSLRRFPRLRSTYAQALFLHRLFPRASWTDEVVHDPRAYEINGSPDWVSGACMLVRRSMLGQVGGWDTGFFLYAEDTDLCRRFADIGREVRFVPDAVARHAGGASMPRTALLPVLARSRIRYARIHEPAVVSLIERAGIFLSALTHLVVGQGGNAARRGHLRAAAVAVMPRRSSDLQRSIGES